MRTDGKGSARLPSWTAYSLSAVFVLVCWKIGAVVIDAPLILPPPEEVFESLLTLAQTASFWHHVAATVGRVFLSFLITVLCGSVIGVFGAVSSFSHRFIEIPLAIIRATPVVSFILIALFWFTSSTVPVFVSVLMTLPVMVTAVVSGLSHTDKKIRDMGRVYGFTKKQIFRYITLPSVLPFFTDGALSSFGLSWKVVAAGEVLSIPKWGSGTLLQIAQVHLETAQVLAVTAAVVCLSFIFERTAAVMIHLKYAHRNPLHDISFSSGPKQLPAESRGSSIQIRNLTLSRGGSLLYRDFSLQIAAGSFVSLLAPSGAGKTTLLDYIAGLTVSEKDNVSGTVLFSASSCRIAYLFQEPRLLDHCTLLENVALPLENSMSKRDSYDRASYFLKLTGLGDRLFSFPDELSGGEKQRAALARAFAFPADILFMDEAFQSQDLKIKLSLMELLSSLLAVSARTCILVTHDVREAVSLADRILVLAGRPLTLLLDERNTSAVSCGMSVAERYMHPSDDDRDRENRIIENLVCCKSAPFIVP